MRRGSDIGRRGREEERRREERSREPFCTDTHAGGVVEVWARERKRHEPPPTDGYGTNKKVSI